ncbi:hypothetical protein JTB14_011725 [Gonioctena quinquepunctata]|nr:hypothetical protein JTB14_011725 [Gonioctena quinquepunctata]
MAKKKWSAEQTIEFLEGYESYPCSWDVHSTPYKNKNRREKAYQKLYQLMDIEDSGIAEVKAKIRSIRNAYALEVSKIKNSQHSGAGADEVYKPKVAWFSVADRILKQVVQIRQTQASEIEIESQSELDDATENTQSTTIEEILSPSSSDLSVARKPIPQKLTLNSTAPKRVRKTASSTEKALQGLQEIAQKLDEKPTGEEDNEFDCFGRSVACSLKKLPKTVVFESMAYLILQRLTSNAQQIMRPSSSASSTSYEYPAIPSSNLSHYDSYTRDTNLHSNPQQEQSDILSQAITTSLYDDI